MGGLRVPARFLGSFQFTAALKTGDGQGDLSRTLNGARETYTTQRDATPRPGQFFLINRRHRASLSINSR